MIKRISISLISILTIFSLTACGSLKKNSEANALAATKTRAYQYSQSMKEIEKSINNQLMTMVMVANGMNRAQDMEIKSPLERKLNLSRLRYNGRMIKLSTTKQANKSYNLLEQTPKKIRFIGKRLTSPSDDTFAIYTIYDEGPHRRVTVETIENLVVTRNSSDAVNVSILGIGVNYKDFYNIDRSMKKAYIDEQEQYAVLRRVDSDVAEKLYTEARKTVDGKNYETHR